MASMLRFVAGFIVSLVCAFTLFTLIRHPFFNAFVIALVIAVLYAVRD